MIMVWLEILGTPRWLCKINGSEVSRCEEIGIEKEETHVGGPVYIRKVQNNPRELCAYSLFNLLDFTTRKQAVNEKNHLKLLEHC